MNRRFTFIMVAISVVFIGLFVYNSRGDDAGSTDGTTSSHFQGDPQASVQLLEYGDFQCPACGGYFPILKEIKAKYGDQIGFQFRHFPIVSIHPNAMSAHRAAEAAAQQGKFWEMHDLLYERQSTWSQVSNPAEIFESFAEELSLNLDQYRSDVAAASTKATIDADLKAGQDAGVDSTPGFFLNGKKIDNAPRDVEGFSALIDEALKSQPQ